MLKSSGHLKVALTVERHLYSCYSVIPTHVHLSLNFPAKAHSTPSFSTPTFSTPPLYAGNKGTRCRYVNTAFIRKSQPHLSFLFFLIHYCFEHAKVDGSRRKNVGRRLIHCGRLEVKMSVETGSIYTYIYGFGRHFRLSVIIEIA